ncbi:hypothetical protein [Cupriavidus sp. D39]|nr:hypothetical protein [Cupriavidus sp. D39]MCY0855022.1 hypothetical protein [Cupriavidus sp. D39]
MALENLDDDHRRATVMADVGGTDNGIGAVGWCVERRYDVEQVFSAASLS